MPSMGVYHVPEHPFTMCPVHTGVQGMVSHDDGRTWDGDHRLVLVGDSSLDDCGYPSSFQRADGTIVTVYYAWDIVSEQYNRRRMGVHGAALPYDAADLP